MKDICHFQFIDEQARPSSMFKVVLLSLNLRWLNNKSEMVLNKNQQNLFIKKVKIIILLRIIFHQIGNLEDK